MSEYQEGILAGLADDWNCPYPVGGDGYYVSREAQRWRDGRNLGLRLREMASEHEEAEDVARKMRTER